MIFGVSLAERVTGWARLDEEAQRFVELGVVASSASSAAVLAVHASDCRVIAVNNAGGLVRGVVALIDPRPRVVMAPPFAWHLLFPSLGAEANDEVPGAAGATVAHVVAATLLDRHPAAARFSDVRLHERTHAIDAAMLALLAALRPRKCESVPMR